MSKLIAVMVGCGTIVLLAIGTTSAHVVRGILYPSNATAFVSSPSGAVDETIALVWGNVDTGLRIACFNVANTSPALPNVPGYPRITAVGFELPDARAGFTVVTPSTGDWRVVNNVPATLLGRGRVTLDFALVSEGAGIPPGQPATRTGGTRFCISGPFPSGRNIEQLINGVVVGFQGQPGGAIADIGLWESPERTVPLFP